MRRKGKGFKRGERLEREGGGNRRFGIICKRETTTRGVGGSGRDSRTKVGVGGKEGKGRVLEGAGTGDGVKGVWVGGGGG